MTYETATRVAGPAVRAALYLHRAWLRLRGVRVSGSVLHIGFQVHVVFRLSQLLERQGTRSKFLAIGAGDLWDGQDYQFHRSQPSWSAPRKVWHEAACLLRVLNAFEVLHVHNGRCLSDNGWIMKQWRALGRPIVVHWRGCDIRNYQRNVELHPEGSICENCDYDRICMSEDFVKWQNLFKEVAHVHLVTTPDLRDFVPEAHHFPFTLPISELVTIALDKAPPGRPGKDRPLKILHVTNHPGIEATSQIEAALDRLRGRGYLIQFTWLRGEPFATVAKAYADADLGIGKMKMGYYANSQIECLFAAPPVQQPLGRTHINLEYIQRPLGEFAVTRRLGQVHNDVGKSRRIGITQLAKIVHKLRRLTWERYRGRFLEEPYKLAGAAEFGERRASQQAIGPGNKYRVRPGH